MSAENINSNSAFTYESEYLNTLNNSLISNKLLKTTKYFLDTTFNYFDLNKIRNRKPKVIILGTSIPEEYIYSVGALPYWILGGSLVTTSWADDFVPRDTDPVSQSILGYLLNAKFNLAEDAVIVVPITCDSARKMAFLLKRSGKNILTVDIPPVKNDLMALKKWEEQMERMTDVLSSHTGRKISNHSLMEAVKTVGKARQLMRDFIQIAKGREYIINESLRMLVLCSYYYTEDIVSWTKYLEQLITEIKSYSKNASNYGIHKPNILLMGSPIFFPNYKIPFLIQDIGLTICANADIMTEKIYTEDIKETGLRKETIFREIAKSHYQCDCSGAYANNSTLYNHVVNQLKSNSIDGVVYHVLKGQIEYDFELEHYEKLFSSYGIPVFRLETDYQYQDVEQIRIRIEAFMEMLMQNQYSKNHFNTN